jgi:hypothetical protein
MAKSDLLKEAIADAKAVKETALANAKLALQEAFLPRMKEMLTTELTNELEGEDELPVDDSAMNMDAPVGDEMDSEMDDEMGDENGVEWIDNDLSFSVGGQNYDAEIDNAMEDEDEFAAGEDAGMEAGMEAGAEAGFETGDEFADEEEDEFTEELNLESIIRELEEDLTMGDDETGDVSATDDDGMQTESIDDIIEAILREEEDDKEDEKKEDDKEKKEMKKELEEAYNTVRQLKSIINEVNLLNAKLLYTNKLFRNFELSEGQKMKVIENFDRAANTREAKLVFTTLAESFKRPTKKRVVKESAASRPSASTAPKAETTKILSEGFDQAERWKKLAGLL